MARFKDPGDFVSGDCSSYRHSASYVYAEVHCPTCPADADGRFWIRWHDASGHYYLDKQGV